MSFISITPKKRVRVLESTCAGDNGEQIGSLPCKILTKDQAEYRSILRLDLSNGYFTTADVNADPFFPNHVATTDAKGKVAEKNPIEASMDLVHKAYLEVSAVSELSKILRKRDDDIKTVSHENFPNTFTKIPESKVIELKRQSLASISSNVIETGIVDSLNLMDKNQSVIRQITDLQRYWSIDVLKAQGIPIYSVICNYDNNRGNNNSNSNSSSSSSSSNNSNIVKVQLLIEGTSLFLGGDARNFRKSNSRLKFKTLNFELVRREAAGEDGTEEDNNYDFENYKSAAMSVLSTAAGGGGGTNGYEKRASDQANSDSALLASINSWDERDRVDQHINNKDEHNSSAFISYLREKYVSAYEDTANFTDFNNLLDIHDFCLRRQHEEYCRMVFDHLLSKFGSSDRFVIDGRSENDLPSDLNRSNSAPSHSNSKSDSNVANVLDFFGAISNSFEIKSLSRSKIVLSVSSNISLIIELKDRFYNKSNNDSVKSTDYSDSSSTMFTQSSNYKNDLSTFLADKLRACHLKAMIFTYYHNYKSPSPSEMGRPSNGLTAMFLAMQSVVADVGDKKTPSINLDNNTEHPFEEIMTHQDLVLPLSLVGTLRASILRYLTEKSLSLIISDKLKITDDLKFVRNEGFQTRKIVMTTPSVSSNRETYEISRGIITNRSNSISQVINYQIMAVFSAFEDNLLSGNHANLFSSEYIYRLEFDRGVEKSELFIHIVQGKYYLRWINLPEATIYSSGGGEVSVNEGAVDRNAFKIFNTASESSRFYEMSEAFHHIKHILSTFTL